MERQQKAYKGVIDYFKNEDFGWRTSSGEKLPPERDIAERLNVSRNSVREAIRIMDMTGVISSQQGSGNYITCEFQKMSCGDDDDDVCYGSDRLQADQSDTSGVGMSGLFACNRECNRWSDRRNGESSKGTWIGVRMM